jgi:hypothetical protein
MKDDVVLKNVGKENPFKVPEGYFENFTENLMEKLPEKEEVSVDIHPSMWVRMKPWVYMAAFFVGTVLMFRLITFIQNDKVQKQQAAKANTEISQDRYINEVVSNSRLDDYQLYQLLSEAGNEKSK